MSFRIMPALDLRGGRCVRLLQGDEGRRTEYAGEPASIAADFCAEGARWLHIVNLEGAFGRTSGNLEVLGHILREVPVRVQFGGGLRSRSDVDRVMEAGVEKVILGTLAFEDAPALDALLAAYGSEKIIVAVDARNRTVVSRGWTRAMGLSPADAVAELRLRGVTEVLYTDVERDGMMTGADCETSRMLARLGVGVVCSGGIGTLEHVREVVAAAPAGITGLVVGKALLDGRLSLREVLAVAEEAGCAPC
jgi:phosphoribosylformimino-5-aminoimidazole carboxamide ribotide isomerase